MKLEQDTIEKSNQAEELLRRLDKVRKFQSKYNTIPAQVAYKIAEKMHTLSGFIDSVDTPKNEDEVVRAELKRRMKGEADLLEHHLSGRLYDFDSVIDLYGIPREDIESLPSWLRQNKDGALDSIERLFHSRDIDGYELPLAMDIPAIRRQAEEVAGSHIEKYHAAVGKFLEDHTNVAGFLRDIKTAPSTNSRSYFNNLSKIEKGVDVLIASDMIRKTLIENKCKVSILISGDSDFIPCMQIIKNAGYEVIVCSPRQGFSNELRQGNFRYLIIKKEDMNKCLI